MTVETGIGWYILRRGGEVLGRRMGGLRFEAQGGPLGTPRYQLYGKLNDKRRG